MGRSYTHRRTRSAAAGRPSWFFIAAIAIGLVLLAWMVVMAVSRPAPPPVPQEKAELSSQRA